MAVLFPIRVTDSSIKDFTNRQLNWSHLSMAEAEGVFMASAENSLITQTFYFLDCGKISFAVPNNVKHGSSISI